MNDDCEDEMASADVLTHPDSHGAGDAKLSLAIATTHTPWIPSRAGSMARLQTQIAHGRRGGGGGFSRWDERVFCERMPNHVWSDLMWRWASSSGCSHALFLQDDVILAPGFFHVLHAMIVAKPREVIALHVPQPRARDVLRGNVHRWVTSLDGLVGFAYVMPQEALAHFLDWKATKLRPRAAEQTTEDSLLDAWALDTDVLIHHPVPTIVDHDLELASTYGNDQHTERRPVVTWRDHALLSGLGSSAARETPVFWSTDAVALGRFFPKSHWVARAVLADEQRGAALAALHDRAPFTLSPWVYP